jgi:hypothetical protein
VAHAAQADVADAEAVTRLFAELRDALGGPRTYWSTTPRSPTTASMMLPESGGAACSTST